MEIFIESEGDHGDSRWQREATRGEYPRLLNETNPGEYSAYTVAVP